MHKTRSDYLFSYSRLIVTTNVNKYVLNIVKFIIFGAMVGHDPHLSGVLDLPLILYLIHLINNVSLGSETKREERKNRHINKAERGKVISLQLVFLCITVRRRAMEVLVDPFANPFAKQHAAAFILFFDETYPDGL